MYTVRFRKAKFFMDWASDFVLKVIGGFMLQFLTLLLGIESNKKEWMWVNLKIGMQEQVSNHIYIYMTIQEIINLAWGNFVVVQNGTWFWLQKNSSPI